MMLKELQPIAKHAYMQLVTYAYLFTSWLFTYTSFIHVFVIPHNLNILSGNLFYHFLCISY